MLLKVIVLLGLAFFFFRSGEPGLAGMAAACVIPSLGLFLSMILVGVLLVKTWYGSAAIVAGLIAFNLIGNKLIEAGDWGKHLYHTGVMSMFFKKRVTVADYCNAKLQALTAQENLKSWLELREHSDDQAFRAVSDDSLLDQLLAAHLQLLSLSITKQYHDIALAAATYLCIDSFLDRNGRGSLSGLKDEYNKAFGRSPVDGVSEMVRLLDLNLTNGLLASQTREAIYDLMYKSLSSYYMDFKGQKLVTA